MAVAEDPKPDFRAQFDEWDGPSRAQPSDPRAMHLIAGAGPDPFAALAREMNADRTGFEILADAMGQAAALAAMTRAADQEAYKQPPESKPTAPAPATGRSRKRF
jgi:hypothetical protein